MPQSEVPLTEALAIGGRASADGTVAKRAEGGSSGADRDSKSVPGLSLQRVASSLNCRSSWQTDFYARMAAVSKRCGHPARLQHKLLLNPLLFKQVTKQLQGQHYLREL